MANIKKIKIGDTHYDIKDAGALQQVLTLPATGTTGQTIQYVGETNTLTDMISGCLYQWNDWGTGLITIEDHGPFDDITITNYDKYQEFIDDLVGYHPEDYLITFKCYAITSGEPYWKITVGETQYGTGFSLTSCRIETTGGPAVVGSEFTLMVENYAASEEKWKRISSGKVQYNDIPIVENSLNAGSYQPFAYALSAHQGKVLKDMIDDISAVGRFLAMWDADTGTARNLSTGFQYQSGDYYIVATVAEAPATNYMPTGSTYSGPSTTPATDELYLCDMYYYNGTTWQYLANHAKSIAIDTEMSLTSANPVENRVITAAMALKQDTISQGTGIIIDEDKAVSVDTDVIQEKLTAGSGITITPEEGQTTIATDMDVVQAKLTAGENITITNNVISASGGGGSAGLPCIATVDARQFNHVGAAYNHRQLVNFRGEFDDIVFTTNMDASTLFSKKNDLYVGLYRSKRQENRYYDHEGETVYPGSQRRFVLQNDRRVKTNIRLRCWREFIGSYDYDADPRSWRYFYVVDDYTDAQQLMDSDPYVGLYINKPDLTSNFGTCFNAISFRDEYIVSDIVEDLSNVVRYPEGDIDTIAKKFFDNVAWSSVKCREATKTSDGSKRFIWGEDLGGEEPTTTVLMNPTVGIIPDHVEDLVDGGAISGYTLGKWRHDLAYMHITPAEGQSIEGIVENIYTATHGGDEYPQNHFWNVYWMDYPIQPTRLADCDVLINIKPSEMEEEYVGDCGTYVKLKDLESKPYKNLMKQFVFRYPYATDELWLRFCSWQKRVLYQIEQEEYGITPSWKNNMTMATQDFGQGTNFGFYRRPLGGPQHNYSSYHPWSASGKITEKLQFNLVTCDDISYNLTSQSTPVKKKLASVVYRSYLLD